MIFFAVEGDPHPLQLGELGADDTDGDADVTGEVGLGPGPLHQKGLNDRDDRLA